MAKTQPVSIRMEPVLRAELVARAGTADYSAVVRCDLQRYWQLLREGAAEVASRLTPDQVAQVRAACCSWASEWDASSPRHLVIEVEDACRIGDLEALPAADKAALLAVVRALSTAGLAALLDAVESAKRAR
jgi:hypothetical protein